MIGILVHGDNHFIVRGPLPSQQRVRELLRHWSIITINATTPPYLEKWKISSKEFRENLEWAVCADGEAAIQPAVAQLLEEMNARGVTIHHVSENWLGEE